MNKPDFNTRGWLPRSTLVLTLVSSVLLSACGGGGGGGANLGTGDANSNVVSGGGDRSGGTDTGGSGGEQQPQRTAQTVFIRAGDTGKPLLFTMADDGATKPVTLASSDLFSSVSKFTPSPDKKLVAFISSNALYVVKADGSGLVRLSELNNAKGKVTDFEWSPDSGSLVYVADGEVSDQFELYLVKSDGSDRDAKQRINGTLGNKFPLDIAEPRWSPDGRYVAYLVEDNGRAIGLNTHDTTASDPRNSVRVSYPNAFALWQDIAGYGGPGYRWSPDSHTLAYRSDALKDKLYEIFTVHPDGSDFKRANGATASLVYMGNFTWSPDSRYLAEGVYTLSNTAYTGLNTWDTQDSSGVPSRRVSSATESGGFAWANHAARLAFVDDHEAVGINELYIHDPQAGSITKVKHGGTNGENVVGFNWSPKDGFIAYDAASGFYLAKVGGSDPSQVLYAYKTDQYNFGGWAWSQDDGQIAYWVYTNPVSTGGALKTNLYISTTASPAEPFLAMGPRTPQSEPPLLQWSDDCKVLVTELNSSVYGVNGALNYVLSGDSTTLGFTY